MNESVINLTHCSLIDFYGAYHKNIEIFKRYFPTLEIIARGEYLKVRGEVALIKQFEKKIGLCIDYLKHHNILDEKVIQGIMLSEDEKEAYKDNKVLFHTYNGKKIIPKTKNQNLLIDSIKNHDMIFASGPAGTGKTYISVVLGAWMLNKRMVQRIILTRPAVEAGENLGFLPGDLKEKLDPYLQPLYDALISMIPYERLNQLMEKKTIEIAPLAFMRGRTLDDAFVILDEAQNTTKTQMKMFLTRMGKNAKFIITGDPNQVDLPKNRISGFTNALDKLKVIKEIAFIYFDESDIIRHELVSQITKLL